MTEPPGSLLFYVDAGQFAGAEQSLQTLITHLPATVPVTVAGPERPILDELVRQRPGAAVRIAPSFARKSDLPNAPSLWRLFSEIGPAVIHLNKTEVADLRYVELLLWMRRLGPVVSVVHHVEQAVTLGARVLTRFLASRAAAVVSVDGRVGHELEELLGLPSGSVVVIPNALPPLIPLPDTNEVEPSGAPFVVGVLARLVRHKRVDHVLRAVADLPDVRLVIGGDGPERRRLEQLAWTLKMSDRVTFLGWADPDLVFERCDVLASAAKIEGHSMALLDARRRGVPVVAVDVGGVAAIVEHEVTGLLVPAFDVPGLSTAIDRLRTSPGLRLAMHHAALTAARADPGPSAMAEEYCDLYWPGRDR